MGKSNKDELAAALEGMSGSGNPAEPAGVERADDVAAAPSPDASVFAPRHSTADLLARRRLRAQRTAIPVMLTCGLLLPAIGALKWLAAEDSVFAQWDAKMPILLSLVGVLILAVAVINMLQVRDALRRQAESRGLTGRGASS